MLLIAAINWHSFFFLLFALVTCGFALGVLFSSNIVRMAFYLTIALGTTSGLFILAGAHFVGAMQLMIYVGGTLVLLIFGVMLTAHEGAVLMKTRAGDWVVAVIAGGSLLALLISAAVSIPTWRSNEVTHADLTADDSHSTSAIGLALIGVRTDIATEKDATLRRGLSGYLLAFEIVSVHLLVVLVGAAYLARAKQKLATTGDV